MLCLPQSGRWLCSLALGINPPHHWISGGLWRAVLLWYPHFPHWYRLLDRLHLAVQADVQAGEDSSYSYSFSQLRHGMGLGLCHPLRCEYASDSSDHS